MGCTLLSEMLYTSETDWFMTNCGQLGAKTLPSLPAPIHYTSHRRSLRGTIVLCNAYLPGHLTKRSHSTTASPADEPRGHVQRV